MPSPEPKRVIKKIQQSGIVPVFYHEDPEVCKKVVRACYEGGLRVFEFAFGGARARENYMALKKYAQRSLPDLYIGIGTIKTASTADTFISHNADFIVSPVIDSEIGQLCKEKKVLWIPSCSTPTEIAVAEKCGASLVKIFPGEVLGTSYVKAILRSFPSMQFMPAGSIEPTATNIINWLAAGAAAVDMDDGLISQEMILKRNFTELKLKIKKLLATIKKWRLQNRP